MCPLPATYPVPALPGCEGLRSYDYGHALKSTPADSVDPCYGSIGGGDDTCCCGGSGGGIDGGSDINCDLPSVVNSCRNAVLLG